MGCMMGKMGDPRLKGEQGWSGEALHGKTMVLHVMGNKERPKHVSKMARFVYFVDHAGRGVEDTFKGI